jgi:hypothetical protein
MKMKMVRNLTLLAAGLVCAFAAHAGAVKESTDSQFKPTGKGFGELDNTPLNASGGKAGGMAGTADLSLHGGPVMVAPTNLYYIWYGSQWDTASKNVLTNLGQKVGGSPHYNINTTYYNTAGTKVVNSVTLAGTTINTGTLGTALTDANIQTIVSNAITSGALPADANGVYMVLTDKATTATSGFCTQYCGWHTHATISGKDIKYAFVGNAETQCASSCGATSPSPNNTPGADGAASVLMHELEETVTDPDLNAWYATSNGMENGDKCAWNYGTTSTASNGARYNQTFGTMKYLIQQNWAILPTQACMQHYP